MPFFFTASLLAADVVFSLSAGLALPLSCLTCSLPVRPLLQVASSRWMGVPSSCGLPPVLVAHTSMPTKVLSVAPVPVLLMNHSCPSLSPIAESLPLYRLSAPDEGEPCLALSS